MAYIQSRIERCWNAFALLVCLGAGADVAYWRRNRWEGLLFPLLMMVAGNLFARLIGWFPHAGLTGGDGRDSLSQPPGVPRDSHAPPR
jgi:hypothetical protein